MYTICLPRKLADKQIDIFVENLNSFYSNHQIDEGLILNFSKCEWIGGKEITVLLAFIDAFKGENISIYANFDLGELSGTNVNRRVRLFWYLWDTWKFSRYVSFEKTDLTVEILDAVKRKFEDLDGKSSIYDLYNITPLLRLPKVENYSDKRIVQAISSIYSLNEATLELLEQHNCIVPFKSETIGHIIGKELYENFLDHFEKAENRFSTEKSFLSIDLVKKQRNLELLTRNLSEECIDELGGFHLNENGTLKNNSFVEINYIDFGIGITRTLEKEYRDYLERGGVNFSKEEGKSIETQILEYAFKYDSSRHPINARFKNNFLVPRGLFDILSIVWRFRGLLMARSNSGKIAFDFSKTNDLHRAIKHFGTEGELFPGNLITIYLPERTLQDGFDSSSLKPQKTISDEYTFDKPKEETVSFFEIQKKLKSKGLKKSQLYNALFEEVVKRLTPTHDYKLIYFDFEGGEIDSRIQKKIAFFLSTDYRVNCQNNVVVINPPKREVLEDVKIEIKQLDHIVKDYYFHPTPFVYVTQKEKEHFLDVFWLGLTDEGDERRLTQLLLGKRTLPIMQLTNHHEVHGNIFQVNSDGNIDPIIQLESAKRILDKTHESRLETIKLIISKAIQTKSGSVYLCSGNYYQKEYLQLFDALVDNDYCDFLASHLFNLLKERTKDIDNFKFIA